MAMLMIMKMRNNDEKEDEEKENEEAVEQDEGKERVAIAADWVIKIPKRPVKPSLGFLFILILVVLGHQFFLRSESSVGNTPSTVNF